MTLVLQYVLYNTPPFALGVSVLHNCIPLSQEYYIEQCTCKNKEACISNLLKKIIHILVAYMQELPLCFQTNSTFYKRNREVEGDLVLYRADMMK